MGSKIKAWFYGSLVSVILCTTIKAGVAQRGQQASPSKISSSAPGMQSSFIPFENEQTQTLLVEPQLFLDGIGPQCGGTVWTLEVNGDKKTLRCSNQHAIHGDNKIRHKLDVLFSGNRTISVREARTLTQTGELSNPSGVILFITNRMSHSASIVVDRTGNLSDIFHTQEAFETWLQEADQAGHLLVDFNSKSQTISSTDDSNLVSRTLDTIDSVLSIPKQMNTAANGLACIAGVLNSVAATPALSYLSKVGGALEFAGAHLGSVAGTAAKVLGPVGTALAVAQAVGLDEFAKNMPQLLYPAGNSEKSKFIIIHGKIAIAFLDALAREQGIESYLDYLAWMSACIHFYNVQQGLLSQEWRQKFKKHPQKAIEQLALEGGQNVCCLIIGSGRFVCPNFFQTLYVCRQDPESKQLTSEVIKSRGLKDDRVMNAFSEKCTFDELVQGKTRLFVIDKKADQIYLVSYEPKGKPQFLNIFTPENWNHWKKVFSSLGERLKGTGELLGVSFGKKLRALPVVGNYAADKLGLQHELSSKKAIEDMLTASPQEKTQSNALQLEEEEPLAGQSMPTVSAPKIELGMGDYSNDPMEMNDFDSSDFSDSLQDDDYSLKAKKLSEGSRKDWQTQVTHMEAILYDHPYDGDEYIDETPDFRVEDHDASGIPLVA